MTRAVPCCLGPETDLSAWMVAITATGADNSELAGVNGRAARETLLGQAAEAHGLALPNPHAAYGSPDRIRAVVDRLGLTLIRVERDTFPDLLDDEPRSASIGSSTTASSNLFARHRTTFARRSSTRTPIVLGRAPPRRQRRYDTLFTRCQLPRP